MNVEKIDNLNHIFPRLIQQFSIDSGEIKQILLMFKAFRSAPLADDINITVAVAPTAV
jgi:hypothetical protein